MTQVESYSYEHEVQASEWKTHETHLHNEAKMEFLAKRISEKIDRQREREREEKKSIIMPTFINIFLLLCMFHSKTK